MWRRPGGTRHFGLSIQNGDLFAVLAQCGQFAGATRSQPLGLPAEEPLVEICRCIRVGGREARPAEGPFLVHLNRSGCPRGHEANLRQPRYSGLPRSTLRAGGGRIPPTGGCKVLAWLSFLLRERERAFPCRPPLLVQSGGPGGSMTEPWLPLSRRLPRSFLPLRPQPARCPLSAVPTPAPPPPNGAASRPKQRFRWVHS